MFEIKSLLRQFLSIHWSSNPNYDRFIIHSFTLSNYFFGGLEKSSHIFNNMRSMFSNRLTFLSSLHDDNSNPA